MQGSHLENGLQARYPPIQLRFVRSRSQISFESLDLFGPLVGSEPKTPTLRCQHLQGSVHVFRAPRGKAKLEFGHLIVQSFGPGKRSREHTGDGMHPRRCVHTITSHGYAKSLHFYRLSFLINGLAHRGLPLGLRIHGTQLGYGVKSRRNRGI